MLIFYHFAGITPVEWLKTHNIWKISKWKKNTALN